VLISGNSTTLDGDVNGSRRLKDILARIESRLKALGLTAYAASAAAGRPDSIRNLRRLVEQIEAGAPERVGRRGVNIGTLAALAPVLETTAEWLLTGSDGRQEDEAVVDALTWMFQALEQAPEPEARVAARAVLRAARTLESRDGEHLSAQQRRELVETAIRLFRRSKP